MKEAFHRIMSIAMAFIVLFSTMSFAVEMHYCGDHLVDFSLFEEVDTCMLKAEMSTSSSECALMDMDMDCCSDIAIVVDGQDDLNVSFHQLSFDQQLFFTSFIYSNLNLFEGLEQNVMPFKDYSPPPLIREIQILDQTFLI